MLLVSEYLILSVFILILFSVRIIPAIILYFRGATIGDQTTHFAFIKDINLYGASWTKKYRIKLRHEYPAAFHKLCGYLHIRNPLFLNSLPSLIQVLFLAFCLVSFAADIRFSEAVFLSVCVLANPSTVRQFARDLSFSARVLGENLVLVFLVVFFIPDHLTALNINNPYNALFFVILGISQLFFSKFGFQLTVVFVFLGTFVVDQFLGLLTLATFSAAVYWVPRVNERFRAFLDFSSFAREQSNSRTFGRVVGSRPIEILLTEPLTPLFIFIVLAGITIMNAGSSETWTVFFLLGLLAYIATSFRAFAHLGEPDRYLDIIIVFFGLGIVLTDAVSEPWLIILSGVALAGSLVSICYWSLVAIRRKSNKALFLEIEKACANHSITSVFFLPIRMNFECRLYTDLDVGAYPGSPTSSVLPELSPDNIFEGHWGTRFRKDGLKDVQNNFDAIFVGQDNYQKFGTLGLDLCCVTDLGNLYKFNKE